MPFFSIYAPQEDHTHYYTVTLIGYQRGLVVRWTPHPGGWSPSVMHLDQVAEFNGSYLEGYRLVAPENIDTFALKSMTNKPQT